MSLTRRSVLRNLGALSAVRPLSAIGSALVLGCKEAPKPAPAAPPAPVTSTIRILFEGPWLFSRGKNNTLNVTATGDPNHVCNYGLWDNQGSKILKPATMPVAIKWFAEPIPNSPSFNAVYRKAAIEAKTVFLEPEILKGRIVIERRPNDRIVTLPMPDHIYFAGRLSTAKVTYKGADLGTAPSVTTILEYDRPGPSPTIAIKNGDTPIIDAIPANDLVFQMYHKGMSTTPDVKHIEDAFKDLMSMVKDEHKKPYAVTLAVQNDCFDPYTGPGKFTDAELNIKPCPAPTPPGGLHPEVADFSNCAGGGLGVGCDDDSCDNN
jgi:hypothetical protein